MRNKESQLKKKRVIPKANIFAKKSFGQNFLIDNNYINKIIAALNPQQNETIIEIGAGRGALTEKLIESGSHIIAIELDRDLIPLLREKFAGYNNFRLIEQDALKTNFKDISEFNAQNSKFKLVANLPYYISTAILQKLIEQRAVFDEMILMFQREVVERITAKAGNTERGFLTILVEAYLKTEKLFDVPPSAFRPAPKVWSSVMRLITKEENEVFLNNEHLFRELISTAFAQKRKTILNNLKNSASNLKRIGDAEKLLKSCEIDPNRRAETLLLEEWKKILNAIENIGVT